MLAVRGHLREQGRAIVAERFQVLRSRESLVYTDSMKAFMRAFLLWLMVLAVSAQGTAASLMLFCGTSHTRMMHGTDSEHHGRASSNAHDHAAHSATSTQPSAVHVDASHGGDPKHEGVDSFAHLGQLSCSACAACCSVMALPSSVLLPVQSNAVHPVPAVSAVSVQSHQPEGPDRPPRVTSA